MNLSALVEIVSVGLAIASLSGTVVALRRTRAARYRCVALETAVAVLERDAQAAAALATAGFERLESARRELATLADRVEMLESRASAASLDGTQLAACTLPVTTPASGASLDHAIDWARLGADPAQISQRLGLSPGEADLVTRLHGRKKRG